MQLWFVLFRQDLKGWFLLLSIFMMALDQRMSQPTTRRTFRKPVFPFRIIRNQYSILMNSSEPIESKNLVKPAIISRLSSIKQKLMFQRSALAIGFLSVKFFDYKFTELHKNDFDYEYKANQLNLYQSLESLVDILSKETSLKEKNRSFYTSRSIYHKNWTKAKRNVMPNKTFEKLLNYYHPLCYYNKSNNAHRGKSCTPLITVDKVKLPSKNRPEVSICGVLASKKSPCQPPANPCIITPYPTRKETTKSRMKLNFELDYGHADGIEGVIPTLGVNMMVKYTEEPSNNSSFSVDKTSLLVALVVLVIVAIILAILLVTARKNKQSRTISDQETDSEGLEMQEPLYGEYRTRAPKSDLRKDLKKSTYLVLSEVDKPVSVYKRVPIAHRSRRGNSLLQMNEYLHHPRSNPTNVTEANHYFRKGPNKPIYKIIAVDDMEEDEEKDEEYSEPYRGRSRNFVSRDKVIIKTLEDSIEPDHLSDPYHVQTTRKISTPKRERIVVKKNPSHFNLKRIKNPKVVYEESVRYSSPVASSRVNVSKKPRDFYREKDQPKHSARAKHSKTDRNLLFLDKKGGVHEISSENLITTHHTKNIKFNRRPVEESEQEYSNQTTDFD